MMPATRPFQLLTARLVGLFALLALLVWFGIVQPIRQVSEQRAQTREAQAKQAEVARQLAEQEVWETLDSTLRDQLATVQAELSSFHHEQTYIREIHQLSDRHQVALRKVHVREDAAGIELSFDAEGSFAALVDFCYEVETHALPIRIDRLRVEPKDRALLAHLDLLLWQEAQK